MSMSERNRENVIAEEIWVTRTDDHIGHAGRCRTEFACSSGQHFPY